MKNAVLFLMIFLLGIITSNAQIGQGGYPVSFNKANAGLLQSVIPTKSMRSVDVQRLMAEDAINDRNKEIPWRFGENISVDINIKTDGVNDILPNGDKLYRVRVFAAGAYSINLTFDNYKLPSGAKLFIYDALKTRVYGAFTDFNNQIDNHFATSLIQGDAIIIEYFEPKNAQFSGTLHLSRVTYGYRNVLDFTAKALGGSGACNNNVACALGTGWDNEIKSVCMLVVGGAGFCTGALVNNTAQDGTPYVLTANHCSTANDFASWVFWWNWQSAACANPGVSPAHDQTTTSGSVLKARNAGSDFCLVQMNQTPPSTFNVYYAGWNYGTTAATSTMGIHHPSGDIKKISSAGAATTSTYSGATTWNVNWTSGVTEPGSSGSPLFDQNHKIIGQLFGGTSACGAAPGNLNDDYGKFSVSWSTGGTPSTQLVTWLDPSNLNPTTLAGLNLNAPAVSLDAKANSVIIPTATYCTNQNIIPTVQIMNIGTTNLIGLTVSYHIDGGAITNQNWTGNIATNATAQVTFPQIMLSSGSHRFYFSVSAPNGGTDLNLANDTLSIQYTVGGASLPFSEGFEGATFPPALWSINNPDNATTWTQTATAGNGTSTNSAFIDFLNYNTVGELDDLVSPVMDLTTLSNASLSFNVAYRRFDNTTNDGLDIYISIDCGATFNAAPIYSKAGTVLATGPDNNASAFIPAVAGDWRLETVDLTPYVGNNIVLQFQGVNAFGNNLYIDDINIISTTIPPVANFTQSDTASCIGNISFTDLSTNAPTSWLWNFGDGTTATTQSPVHSYVSSGYFTVTLTATNAYGNNTVTKTNLIHINLPTAPTTADVARCGTGTVTLTATGSGILQWYDAAAAGNFLGSGTSYTTPSISSTTSYYVENHIEQTSQFVTTALSGANGATYSNADECWLVFNVLADMKLVSVEVNASTAGNRLIELRNSAGTVLYSTTINIPVGVSRINLGFNVSVGTGYTLVGPPNANLWRSSTAVVAYPYSLTGIVDIVSGGRTTSPIVTNRYYYFHNWEVKLADCISSRVVANAVINTSVLAGTASASPVSVITGSTSTLTLTGATGNIQWQQSANGIIGWANVTGGTGATTAAYTTSTLSATTYYRAVVSSASCASVNSNIVTITVSANPLTSSITAFGNVNCNGGNNGSATVTVTGGTGTYNYLWSNAATTASVSNLVAGVYTVTVVDAAFSTSTATVTITQPGALTSIPTSFNTSCFGGNNGSINLAVAGGTSPYTYLWSNAATTQNISGLIAGIYSVTVTDSKICTSISIDTIAQPTLLSLTISNQMNVSCNAGNNGSATVLASGGTGIYSYSWSTGSIGATVSNLIQGIYTATAIDANACSATTSVTITEPAAIVLTPSSTNATCGNPDGSATISATGGTGSYTYNWSNAATTASINTITAGAYSVTVSDVLLCTATSTVNVSNTGGPTLTTSVTNVTCNGLNNGTATANATGGTGVYSYSWSNAATTATINNLVAGTYGVTVTDAGCVSTSSAIVVQPAPLVASYTSTPILCFGGNSTVTVSATGGTAPYVGTGTSPVPAGTYSLPITDAHSCSTTISGTITQPSAITLTTVAVNSTCGNANGSATASATGGTGAYAYLWSNAITNATINNVAAGSYTVTVTDANSCSATSSTNIGNSSGSVLTLNGTAPTCNGGTNGSATVSVTGGATPYSYLWSTGETIAAINNISAGAHSVSVTDNNGCISTGSVMLPQPSAIVLTTTVSDATCGSANGAVAVVATGGTGAYSYNWSNSATTAFITNLAPGVYLVTVTDANTCSAIITANVSSAGSPTLSISGTNTTCNGSSTGTATVVATGGVLPYTYLWSSGGTGVTENNIAAGIYSVSVTGNNGCVATTSITINQPSPIIITPSVIDAACGNANGSASVMVSGGTGAYTYFWSNSATTSAISNVSAGAYSVLVSDANSCTATIAVNINNTGSPILTSSGTNLTCFDIATGSATVSVTGGASPYTYQWSTGASTAAINNIPAGTHSVTVTDSNGCLATATVDVTQPSAIVLTTTISNATCGSSNGAAAVTATGGVGLYIYHWSNAATTSFIANLSAGSYLVTVTDANTCSAIITANVSNTGSPVLSINGVNALCNGSATGSATVAATGGATPYTYLWSTGETISTANNLTAGNHSVSVTDNNGCIAIATTNISQPSAINITATSFDATCGSSNGSASVIATGGTGSYSYNWSNAANTTSINNLSAGSYFLTVTDANACSATISANVSNIGSPALTISGTNTSCNGWNNGTATVLASGGVTPYFYHWTSGGTGVTENNLSAGNYAVSVTDNNGCIATASIVISQPALIVLTSNVINASCGSSNGSIMAIATGGTGVYTYLWSNAATTSNINNLPVGFYNVTVTDANTCTATISAQIGNTGSPILTINSTNTSCNGGHNGSATVIATGGTSPYSYLWSTGGINSTINNLSVGSYFMTITDNNGCVSTSSISITQPTAITLTTASSNASCGSSDGSSIVVATGGTGSYSYNWSNGGNTDNISNLAAGVYFITVSDGNNCYSTSFSNVSNAGATALTITGTSIACNGNSNGSATASSIGGVSANTYHWSTGANSSTIINLVAGTYFVSATDANGCIATGSLSISEPAIISTSISGTNIGCFGASTGSVAVTVTGGTPDYTYLWSNGGISASIANIPAAVYNVTITDNNGCSSYASYTITQPSQIIATPVVSNVTTLGGNDGSINLSVTGGVAPYSFAWSNGFTAQNINSLIAGVYTVTLTDGSGCLVSLANTVLDGATLISKQIIPSDLNVYPNPSNGVVNVAFYADEVSDLELKITNVEGKVIYLTKYSKGSYEFKRSLDLSSLPKGIYQLHINTNNYLSHRIIILQ